MKRLSALIYFLLLTITTNAQSRWEDYFSYSEVKEIHQIENKLYCVSSNAIFTYDLESNEVKKISKVNFLNGVKPSSATYNQGLGYFIVGYENGELDILGERSQNFIEIPLDDYTGNKRINHLSTEGNLMLISAAYGVSLFNLDKREFSETTFFTQNGNFITVNESDFFDNKIYSASANGIYFHELNELIPNFNNWTRVSTLPTQEFQHIQRFGDKLVASANGNVYVLQNGSWNLFKTYSNVTDLNTNDNHLIVSTNNQVIVFNESLQEIQSQNFNQNLESGYWNNNIIYAGTANNGLIASDNLNEFIFPDGPFSNSSYNVTAIDNNIWVAPGGTNNFNQPAGNKEGYFHFDGEKWNHIKNTDLNNAEDIIQITLNPNNINQIYASTWGNNNGLLEIENDVLKNDIKDIFLNQHSDNSRHIRLGGSVFDNEGNLYVSQSFISPTNNGHSAILRRNTNGSWQSVIFNNVERRAGIKTPVIDRDGFVWVPQTRGDGVKIANRSLSNSYEITSSNGDLPSNNIYTINIDQNGTAWFGTQLGLRVKNNPAYEVERGNPTTEPVVIVQNGIPEALFTDTTINDIKTDSSNRKWVATQGAGVFYISESGREIIYQFTEGNSPLPSNNVNAIAVDTKTGNVYFATENGLVSYKGDAVDSGDGFGEVVAYPNPVRPNYNGNVTIKGLAKRTNVKIVDVVGNLIYSGTESGGVVQWDQKNLKGQKVASGVYIVLLISGDGLQTKTTKIAIIR